MVIISGEASSYFPACRGPLGRELQAVERHHTRPRGSERGMWEPEPGPRLENLIAQGVKGA